MSCVAAACPVIDIGERKDVAERNPEVVERLEKYLA